MALVMHHAVGALAAAQTVLRQCAVAVASAGRGAAATARTLHIANSSQGLSPLASCSGASHGFSTGPAVLGSLLEIREYTLHPSGIKDYLKLTAEHAKLRSSLLPFKGMFTCDTGAELNKVTHFYTYDSMEQRDEIRAAAARNADWSAYVDAGRQYMQKQESRIMVESTQLYTATGSPGAAAFKPLGGAVRGMYELRQYQLHPGYGSVPKLLKAFEDGLPDKIAADTEGRLVAFAHSDVGTLNHVLEFWRYPSSAACIRARQAARLVPKWRETIAAVTPGVQFFTTSFMVPCTFSPWH